MRKLLTWPPFLSQQVGEINKRNLPLRWWEYETSANWSDDKRRCSGQHSWPSEVRNWWIGWLMWSSYKSMWRKTHINFKNKLSFQSSTAPCTWHCRMANIPVPLSSWWKVSRLESIHLPRPSWEYTSWSLSAFSCSVGRRRWRACCPSNRQRKPFRINPVV